MFETQTRGVLPQPEERCRIVAVNLQSEDCLCLLRTLKGSRWIPRVVQSCRDATAEFREEPAPVVLCGPRMPDGDWKALMDALCRHPDAPAVIVASRAADDRLWSEVLNLGGYDVMATPFERNELFRVLFLAWNHWQGRSQRKPVATKKSPAAERRSEPRLMRTAATV